jgi:glycosyltransferase involved in cell wall biosynthesis
MACGCTPVATDCPTGPSEVLKDGRYGYLIPMHKPKAMAAAIQKALEHPVPRGLLNEAIEPFTEERVLARHAEALKEDFLQPAVN